MITPPENTFPIVRTIGCGGLCLCAGIVIYVASYCAAWSVAVRIRAPAPISWAIYDPIPTSLKVRMLRSWMKIDGRIEYQLTW